MKLTRRKLAATVLGGVAAAQTPPLESADELLKAARDRIKANSDVLARQEVPMSTEPAFQFEA